MTLDEARDLWRDSPSEVTAAAYRDTAQEYCDDGIIEEDTLQKIVQETASFSK